MSLSALSAVHAGTASQCIIDGPAGSGAFGAAVRVLPNGHWLVTDPLFDLPGGVADAGAVYHFDAHRRLLASLTGASAGDRIGSGGIVVLSNGSYLVLSPMWDGATGPDAGAVTFAHADRGASGVVSAANSLVGGAAQDRVGSGARPLRNGNYLVVSPDWDGAGVRDAGAVSFGSGSVGVSGLVSAANSLIGVRAGDQVGVGAILELADGDYVVMSPLWDDDAIADAGAVTRGSGRSGVTGPVSSDNSLLGSSPGDRVGLMGGSALPGGAFLVASPLWRNGTADRAGAVTYLAGGGATRGRVSTSNSLVGSSPDDFVGAGGIEPLANGSYVVVSPGWRHGRAGAAGAVTFGSAAAGVTGMVSASNSLVGSSPGDLIGFHGITALPNGNYVVASASWRDGAVDEVGAVTFGSGTLGVSGAITAANSLLGTQAGDRVGDGRVVALATGNYVVQSGFWNDGSIRTVGAVTFASGERGVTGRVSPENSLVGTSAGDLVGIVRPLANGNYVVTSTNWDDGPIEDVGAVTWGSGSHGIVGRVSRANSLLGQRSGDRIGFGGTLALTNGNFVVLSPWWANGALQRAGAVTFGLGDRALTGSVTASNSLIGAGAGDQLGFGGVAPLRDGRYAVQSIDWRGIDSQTRGAVTLGLGDRALIGTVDASNSILGTGAVAARLTPLPDGALLISSRAAEDHDGPDAGFVIALAATAVRRARPDSRVDIRGGGSPFDRESTLAYDPVRKLLFIGQPRVNRVVVAQVRGAPQRAPEYSVRN